MVGGEAMRLFEQVVDENPSDLNTRMVLFEIAKELGDEAKMDEHLAQLESMDPDGPEFLVSEASRLCWQVRRGERPKEELARAKILLSDLKSKRSNWDRIPKLEAEIQILEEDFDGAITTLQESIAVGDASPTLKSQLLRLLVKQDRRG